jgi:aspartyl-tRNA(Asn)/glutamyl-tRNA(Gln) amidotransferase subunit C
VEQMRAVDTAGIEPLSHPIAALRQDLSLRLRDDVVTESDRREDYQKLAPATEDGLYLVPKVIE